MAPKMLHIPVIVYTQLWNCGDVPFLAKPSVSAENQQSRSKNPKCIFSSSCSV